MIPNVLQHIAQSIFLATYSASANAVTENNGFSIYSTVHAQMIINFLCTLYLTVIACIASTQAFILFPCAFICPAITAAKKVKYYETDVTVIHLLNVVLLFSH